MPPPHNPAITTCHTQPKKLGQQNMKSKQDVACIQKHWYLTIREADKY